MSAVSRVAPDGYRTRMVTLGCLTPCNVGGNVLSIQRLFQSNEGLLCSVVAKSVSPTHWQRQSMGARSGVLKSSG